jgi:hypothetical protein
MPNGVELCRAARRERLLLDDLQDCWRVRVPPSGGSRVGRGEGRNPQCQVVKSKANRGLDN